MDSRRYARTGMILAAMVGALGWALPSVAQASQKAPAHKPSASTASAAKDDPEVVAIVNGEKITRSMVASELLSDQIKKLSATDPNFADRTRPVAAAVGALVLKRLGSGTGVVTVTRAEIVDWLFKDKSPVVTDAVQNKIREVVIEQAAKAAGIKVTDQDVEAQYRKSVAGAKTQLHQEGKSDTQFLDGLGMRADTVRRLTRTSLLLEKLIKADYEKKTGGPIGPSDFVEARNVMVRVTPPAASKPGEQPSKEAIEKAFAEGKAKIDGILADIKSGKLKFEDAAKANNEDATKLQEGRLGIIMRGQMVPEFEKVAFSLPVQQLSDPVRTQFGWHIIRVDRLGKDLSPAERDQAMQGFLRGKANALLSELISKAKIVNKCEAAPGMPMLNLGGGEPD